MQSYSSVQVTRAGLGLDYVPPEYQYQIQPQPEPARTPQVSAQRYSPDGGYQTSSGYYDPALEGLSWPPGWLSADSGTVVDTWA